MFHRNIKPTCQHVRLPSNALATPRLQLRFRHGHRAVNDAEGTDEPGISKEDLGIRYSQPSGDTSEQVSFPQTVPLLPFPVEEVILPGSVKTLHLFEARYLSLLDEVLNSSSSNKLFGHVVVEQPGDAVGSKASAFPGAYVGDNFVFLMGTLVRVIEVKSLQIGALVKIQAEARISVEEVLQVQPYIRASVALLQDEALQESDRQMVHDQMQQLQSMMQDLQNLAQKFRTKQTAALQQAMYWWERTPLIPAAAGNSSSSAASSNSAAADSKGLYSPENSDISDSSSQATAIGIAGEDGGSDAPDLAERAARLSFAALQCTPEASPMEQLRLLRCYVNAMETSNTSSRLKLVHDHMQESQKLLAAKVALKTLNLG